MLWSEADVQLGATPGPLLFPLSFLPTLQCAQESALNPWSPLLTTTPT